MEIMGHVSEAMYRRYCHRSTESRRDAALSLERPISSGVLSYKKSQSLAFPDGSIVCEVL
jgi:hypothetical protein